jgi:hypothetical protein
VIVFELSLRHVSSRIINSFPYVYIAPVDGLDVEVFSFELLKEAHGILHSMAQMKVITHVEASKYYKDLKTFF